GPASRAADGTAVAARSTGTSGSAVTVRAAVVGKVAVGTLCTIGSGSPVAASPARPSGSRPRMVAVEIGFPYEARRRVDRAAPGFAAAAATAAIQSRRARVCAIGPRTAAAALAAESPVPLEVTAQKLAGQGPHRPA